jgi:MFS family permease
MDIFTKTFFYPTFTNHLTEKFGMSIEGSSIFFVINIASYFLVLNYINYITMKLGLKLTIVIGLFCLVLGVLFIGPISLLPQSLTTIVIGLLILGIPSALVNVSAICDLIDLLKTNRLKLDENSANDMAAAIYNLGLNFGEAVGPIFGGYVTEKINFETSCAYTSVLNLIYGIFFLSMNYEVIKTQLHDNKAEAMIEGSTGSLRKTLTDDYKDYQVSKGPVIDKDRPYAGRYRSYSYSSRGSKRSSFSHHGN